MKKIGDFFKRIKVEPKEVVSTASESSDTPSIEIQIEGNIDLFKDEKEKIILGARQLLEIGKADNIEDAIITYAVMFRGLKFSKVHNTKEGKNIVVLRETAQREER